MDPLTAAIEVLKIVLDALEGEKGRPYPDPRILGRASEALNTVAHNLKVQGMETAAAIFDTLRENRLPNFDWDLFLDKIKGDQQCED